MVSAPRLPLLIRFLITGFVGHNASAVTLATIRRESFWLISLYSQRYLPNTLRPIKSELLLAQKTHAELLRTMTNDEAIPMNLLLVHAEDHVASSEVVLTMANELFVVYSILNEGKVY